MKKRSLPQLNSKTKSIIESSEKIISDVLCLLRYLDNYSKFAWPPKTEIVNVFNKLGRHKDSIGTIGKPETYDEIILKQLYVALDVLFINLRLILLQKTFVSIVVPIGKVDNFGFHNDALNWIKEIRPKLVDSYKNSYSLFSEPVVLWLKNNLPDHDWAQKELEKHVAAFYEFLEYSSYVSQDIISLLKRYPVVVDFSNNSSNFDGEVVSCQAKEIFYEAGNLRVKKAYLLSTLAYYLLGHVQHKIYVNKIKSELPSFVSMHDAFLKWSSATCESLAYSMQLRFRNLLIDFISEKKLSSCLLGIENSQDGFYYFSDYFYRFRFWDIFYALCLLLNYDYNKRYPNATVEEALDKYFLSLWLSEYHREEIVRYVKQTVNPQNFSEIKSDCLSNVEYDLKQSCFVVDGIFRKYPDVDKNRLYPIIMSGYWSPSVLPHWVDFCLENDISF